MRAAPRAFIRVGDRAAQRLVAFGIAVGKHEARIARDARERFREFAERRGLVGRDALHERDPARLLLGRELAEDVGELADPPRRQRDPPGNARRSLGLSAAQLRHDPRTRTDPLLDQAVADQLAIGMHDRAAVDAQLLGHACARAAAGSTRGACRRGSPRADARRSAGRAGRSTRGRDLAECRPIQSWALMGSIFR